MNRLYLEYIMEHLNDVAKTISKKDALRDIEYRFSLTEEESLKIYNKWRYNFLNKSYIIK